MIYLGSICTGVNIKYDLPSWNGVFTSLPRKKTNTYFSSFRCWTSRSAAFLKRLNNKENKCIYFFENDKKKTTTTVLLYYCKFEEYIRPNAKTGLPPGNDKICRNLSNGENFDPQIKSTRVKNLIIRKCFKKVKFAEKGDKCWIFKIYSIEEQKLL